MKPRVLHVLLLALVVALLLARYPTQAQAQAQRDRVTIVVLDQSGSMRYDLPERRPPHKASDRLGLRCSAARLLADLATPNDWLGLVKLESHDDQTDATADRTAEVLLAPTAMGTAAARDQFKAQLQCDQAHNNTPIADSLQKAFALLDALAQSRGSDSFEGRVLLLTDGEPAPQGAAQIREIDALLPRFAAKRWMISTVGLRLRANSQLRGIELLQKIAGTTRGQAYGDVDEPMRLQNIFVEFFAEQTGRSLRPGQPRDLVPNGEHVVNVASYAERIDVLVAKENPQAAIKLFRPDGSEVSATGDGVELFSNDDPFYAAFSIAAPAKGNWSIRSDQATKTIVNVLIESDLKIRLDHPAALRASNQPLELSARFYTSDATGQDAPTTITDADVNATVTLRGETATVALHDDGLHPDRAANDGVYSGTFTASATDSSGEALSASVGVVAKTGDASYTDTASLQLVPVPTIDLGEAGDSLRLAPGSPIDVPLYLRLGQRPVDLSGWTIRAFQMVAGEKRRIATRPQADHFVVTLVQLPDDLKEYSFEVELIGVEQNEGLARELQPLALRVLFQPALKLFDLPQARMPVGAPLTVRAALLRSFDTPMPLSTPLQLNVQVNNNPAQPIVDVRDDGSGTFTYTYVPQQPGRYRFTLLP
ncbi:MAG: hypothetical protein JOZ51_12895, partial [Chloroflexi bacterium]|nr:hypothetical protein [Chloroflexota bacterium]